MQNIKVEKIVNGHLEENCYFIHMENNKDGILIDPGIGKNTIINFLEDNNFIVKAILITHAHVDHIYCANNIREKYNCDIYVSKIDNEAMNDPELNVSKLFYMPITIKNCKVFDNNDVLKILNIDIECIFTPGHTKGSSVFYIKDNNILFSGDTLFYGSYGRTDLYGGDDIDMKNSLLNVLFKMPDNTIVYAGHGENTTILNEKTSNMILY